VRNPWPRTPYPDVQQYSYRDYSNRIGFWRMLEVPDAYNIAYYYDQAIGHAAKLYG
jgi:allantoinase